MLYSVLIYDSEAEVEALSPEENEARLVAHRALQAQMKREGRLGPVARLMPTTAAMTLKPGLAGKARVLDGPFAETKEQLVGFYVLDCETLQEALSAASRLPVDSGALEVRPISWYDPGQIEPDPVA